MKMVSNLSDRALQKNPWAELLAGEMRLLQSPLLNQEQALTHAFTTRFGGNSAAPMEWFNLGRHIDDSAAREDAMLNRRRLCEALKLDFTRLAVPAQVHSSRIVPSNAPTFAEVDGVGTNDVGQPILLHFADCVPVMIYDRRKRALAVVHAGWKGTAGAIASKGVQFLHENFGSSPQDIVAAVGPAIGACCYPTGGDVVQRLSQTVSDASRLIDRSGAQERPDLKAINALQLLEAGVDQVDVCDLCTACRPDMFYSHRQSGGKTGRQGAIACITHN